MSTKHSSVESIFGEAIEIEAVAERAAFLEQACQGDAALRRQVETLLDAHHRAGDFLGAPAEPPTTTFGDAPESEGLGATIGPYTLREEIGEGGMGVVYMAEQTQPMRRRVALKVVKPGMDSRRVIARFEAERQALALMDHPNIARVHDAGTTETGRPYFVMELVRGLPITEYCDRESLPIADRLELFVQVCRAVQHAHQKGVIHRDIKPSNVLVTVLDGVAVPKVIDFGIAKAVGASLTEGTMYTGFHQLVGTPLYMSPEQADLSSADVDTRSDVYSLGVLLYELLTGCTPFDGETLRKAAFDEMRRIIREQEPPKPSTRLSSLGETLSTVSAQRGVDARRLDRTIRGELDWIVMKALEKDRRRRYDTANDLATDVMRFLDDRPVEACPPSLRYRLGKYFRRHRGAFITTGTIVLALVAGLAVSAWQAVRATTAERNERALAQKAESQRIRAEDRYRIARETVDEMYTRVAEKWLAGQPSLTLLQKEFLERAAGFYERFVAEAGDDPNTLHEAAQACVRVGRIRRTLEQNTEAEPILRRAIELAAGAEKAYPGQPGFTADLAFARYELGRLLDKTDRKPEAESELRLALAGQESLRKNAPSDPQPRRELVIIHEALGMTLQKTVGRADESLQCYRTALAEAESLVHDFPDDPECQSELAEARHKLGERLQWRTETRKEAEDLINAGLEITTGLLKREPHNPVFREQLAGDFLSLGYIYLTDRVQESETAYRKAIEAYGRLADEFPDIVRHKFNMAGAHVNMAILLNQKFGQARRREEFEALDKGVAIVEEVAEHHPEVPRYWNDVSRTSDNLINYHISMGDLREAGRLLKKLIPHEQALVDSYPDNTNYCGIYGRHLQKYSQNLLDMGDYTEAARWARIFAQRDHPGDASTREGRPFAAGFLLSRCAVAAESDVSLEPARRAELCRSYVEEAQQLFEETVRRVSKNSMLFSTMAQFYLTGEPTVMRNLIRALEYARRATEADANSHFGWTILGLAELRNGRRDEALAHAKRGLELSKGTDAARVYLVLSLIHFERGDQAEARRCFDLAEEDRQKLVKRTGRGWDKSTQGGAGLHVLYDEAAARLGLDPRAQSSAK